MAMEIWIRVSFISLVVSLLLQIFAAVTPWWLVYSLNGSRYGNTEKKVSIFYTIRCWDGHCTADSFRNDLHGAGHYQEASHILIVVVALCLTASVAILKAVFLIRKKKWSAPLTPICMMLLSIANTLQWTEVSRWASDGAIYKENSSRDTTVHLPWSVVALGLGAFLVSVVLLYHLIIFSMAECRRRKHRPSTTDNRPATTIA